MKIYDQGNRIDGWYESVSSFFARVWVWTKIGSVSLIMLASAFGAGAMFFSTDTVTASATEVVEAPAPILDRIADCESGNGKKGTASQINKAGQVLVSVNKGGSYDIGYMQINSAWEAQATKLGYNLFTESGNRAFGRWLYENKGTSPWASSQHCWSR